MTITIADGRGALWQWDTGRRVKITDGADVKQIHYQNRCFGCSVDVDVENDGTAIIPDELLQDYHRLTAYAYVTDDTGAYTMVQQDFAVYKRAKPADYVYTPTEHAGFDRLRSEIGDLADLTTEAKDNLVAAINEAAASGGAGSSVQSDWNQNDATAADYVKNRPFYTGDPVETVLVEESTVTFEDDGGMYIGQLESTFSATVGETYKVSWDGTTYECACVDYSGTTVIGNLSIMGVGSDTGEPFLMGVNNGKELVIYTADTSASHTFSISGTAPQVVKIDEKYLPDNLATKSEVEVAQSTADTAKAIAENSKIDPISSLYTDPSTLFSKSGEFIGWYKAMPILKYDETEGGFRLNYREPHPTSLEDIPFSNFICYEVLNFSGFGYDNYLMFLNVFNSGDKKFVDGTAINTKGNVFYVKSNEVDPSASEGIFLELIMPEYMMINSSTTGSTKKFKITVDDSGTISATEVIK